jgi:hypothetical protein
MNLKRILSNLKLISFSSKKFAKQHAKLKKLVTKRNKKIKKTPKALLARKFRDKKFLTAMLYKFPHIALIMKKKLSTNVHRIAFKKTTSHMLSYE